MRISVSFLLLCSLLSGCSYFPKLVLLLQDPLTAEEHNNLGVAYEKEGKYDLALREYKKAVDKNSNLTTSLVNMGNVYSKQGKYEQAEKNYLKALKKDEMNIEAANNLASLYLTLNKDYEKGLEYLTNATSSLDQVPAYALDTFGVLYHRLGNDLKAKEMLFKACESVNDNGELFEEIEVHLRELGEEGCRTDPAEQSGFPDKS